MGEGRLYLKTISADSSFGEEMKYLEESDLHIGQIVYFALEHVMKNSIQNPPTLI